MVYRIFVEKKKELAHEANGLKNDIRSLLQITSLEDLRILNRYDVENITEELFLSSGFNNFKTAIVVKYILFNRSNDFTTLFTLRKQLHSLFPSYAVYSIVEIPDKILLLITTDKAGADVFFSEILASLYEHLEYITKSFDISATMGISKSLSTLSEVNAAIKSTAAILKSRTRVSPGEIRYFSEFDESVPFGPSYDIYNLKQVLSNLLDSNDGKKAVTAFLEKYSPKNAEFNRTALKFFCFSTIASLQFLITEQNIKINNQFENLDILWTKLNNFETAEETFAWLKDTLITYFEQTLRSKRKDKNDIVSRIKSYINENYQTITSVEQIASVLFISCGYAKNMFKKHTGQTIYDYLVETRITRAKKLLNSSSIKVYEVSELVGYVSKAHFTEVFKKKTGMTPKEYQLKASQENKRWDNKIELSRAYYSK